MTSTTNPPTRTRVEVPLAERDAVTLPEAAALGYGSERTLRSMIATKKLRRCVLRVGKRRVCKLSV